MHQLRLAPNLLLALSSLGFSLVLPTQDTSAPTSVGSEPSASVSSVSENANAMETVVLASVPKLSPDNTCGNVGNGKNKGYTCNPKALKGGACCSAWGNCGNDPPYCGTGCQAGFGKCDGNAGPNQPAPGPPPIPNPNPSVPTQPKPIGLVCGPAFGNKKCPDNLCCSFAGYCGNTPDYCKVPSNCREDFGRCDSDNVPAGGTTSKDPRPLIGNVSYDKPIEHCLKERTIALTFDDGPTDDTSALLDLLARYKAKATFFISGNNNGKGEIDTTQKWFDVIQRMIAEGHQVASHTFDHVRLSTTASDLRKLEMWKNERALVNIIGKYPTYVRAPYSDCTVDSGCRADMKALGYHVVEYDLTTEDYLHPYPAQIQQSKDIVKGALAKAPANGNYLAVQHDTIHQSSSNLTEYFLQLIRKKGWEAVTVGSCVGDPMDNWYREPMWISPGTASVGACVVSRGKFCGTILPFNDKISCLKSAGECMKQAQECPKTEDSGGEGCEKFNNICRLEMAFCMACGGKGQKSCKTKHFEFKIQ